MAWFDAHAGGYDAWYDTELGRYADTVEKSLIGDLAGPASGEWALDVGCGTGNHSIWLAGKGLTVTGLDESEAMLDVAAAKASDTGVTVQWVLGDASALPFEGERFELVVSVAAMEFVEARHLALREAMRVLRPGGRLVLGLLNRDSAWGELYLRDADERSGSVFAHAHLLVEDEVPALLDAPYMLRKGLYFPPDADLDRERAEEVEREHQAQQAARPGFLAVRWVKEES